MVERLSYDSSSVIDRRGDVVPAADYLDADGDIVEPPHVEDTEIYVHVEPVKSRYEEFEKAEKEYDRRLEALADMRNGDYKLAQIELAERNIHPPKRSMFGVPSSEVEDDVLPAAVANAIREDSLRQRINEIFNKQPSGPDDSRIKQTEATRQQAIFQMHEDRRNSRG